MEHTKLPKAYELIKILSEKYMIIGYHCSNCIAYGQRITFGLCLNCYKAVENNFLYFSSSDEQIMDLMNHMIKSEEFKKLQKIIPAILMMI